MVNTLSFAEQHKLCIFWMAGAHTTLITQLLLIFLIRSGSAHDECRLESPCGPNEPRIRFPFQLVMGSQDRCVYPEEFCFYCTENKNTMMVLSTTSGPIKFLVNYIDYETHWMLISDPDNCLPKKFLKLNNSSFLPYRFDSQSETKISFYNCSLARNQRIRNVDQSFPDSQDMITCPIYASNSNEDVLKLDLVSCTKIFRAYKPVMASNLRRNFLNLSWPKPNCIECEAKGKQCKWKNNNTKDEIECFDCNHKHRTIQVPKSFIFATIGESPSYFKVLFVSS